MSPESSPHITYQDDNLVLLILLLEPVVMQLNFRAYAFSFILKAEEKTTLRASN